VRRRAAGFAALGVGRGDTVGFMLVNRPAFQLTDTAAMHLGATCFSIYNTSSPEQIEYVVADAENRVIVTEQAFLEKVLEARERVETLEHVVVIDGDAPEGTISVAELEAMGGPEFDFEATWRDVGPEDVLCLIYTSGTSSSPTPTCSPSGEPATPCAESGPAAAASPSCPAPTSPTAGASTTGR
jgi:long-subunit acyl-CoA synthetase (AMP-forming)